MTQTTINFDAPPSPPIHGPRDGVTFDPARDTTRLNNQASLVYAAMKDGRWRTLTEIHEATGQPEASVSARLRDLRKPQFGGHEVQRRRRGRGQFEYRLVVQGTAP